MKFACLKKEVLCLRKIKNKHERSCQLTIYFFIKTFLFQLPVIADLYKQIKNVFKCGGGGRSNILQTSKIQNCNKQNSVLAAYLTSANYTEHIAANYTQYILNIIFRIQLVEIRINGSNFGTHLKSQMIFILIS